MMLIGIDPGSNGGITSHSTITKITTAIKMPDNDTDIKNYLKSLSNSTDVFNGNKDEDNLVYVLCEKVGGFIGYRTKKINIMCPSCHGMVPYEKAESDPGSTMFKFGDGNGFIRGVCLTLGFGYDTMAPKSWQKIHNLFKTRDMSKTYWKNILKDRAQKLFPQLKVTLNTADSLLILDVLMRMKIKPF